MKSTNDCIIGNIYYVETADRWYVFKAKANMSSCTALKGRVTKGSKASVDPISFGDGYIMSPSKEDKLVREAYWDEKHWYEECVSQGCLCPKPRSVNNYEIF